VLENADGHSAIGAVGHEESQGSIIAERGDSVRESPSSDDGNNNDNDQVEEPRTEQSPSQYEGYQVENSLLLQPEGNSQQNDPHYPHYTHYTYSSQAGAYPIPSNPQTYPPLQYPPVQTFPGQSYPVAYVDQYSSQYVAQSLTGSHGSMVHPQYPIGQPQYPSTYQQGYPVHVVPAAQPIAPPSKTDPDRPRRTKEQEKKHPCNVCGSLFLRPSGLLAHVRTHTGERPFSCRFAGCSRLGAFSVKSNRTRHERKHVRDGRPVPLEVLQELNAKRARNGDPPMTMQGSS